MFVITCGTKLLAIRATLGDARSYMSQAVFDFLQKNLEHDYVNVEYTEIHITLNGDTVTVFKIVEVEDCI